MPLYKYDRMPALHLDSEFQKSFFSRFISKFFQTIFYTPSLSLPPAASKPRTFGSDEALIADISARI